MSTAVCRDCGAEIMFEPLVAFGRAVGTPAHCESCLDKLLAAEEAVSRRARFERRLDASDLPVPLRGREWPDGEAADTAKRWVRDEIKGLVLTGPVGVGKTYLAGCAAWQMLLRRSVRWVSVARLMSQLRASFGDEGRASALAAVQGDGPIVLDDLDKANPTEHGREAIFAAIDQRISAASPLLVTTNLPMGAIAKRMGEPIASRLAGECEVVEMRGADRRLAA